MFHAMRISAVAAFLFLVPEVRSDNFLGAHHHHQHHHDATKISGKAHVGIGGHHHHGGTKASGKAQAGSGDGRGSNIFDETPYYDESNSEVEGEDASPDTNIDADSEAVLKEAEQSADDVPSLKAQGVHVANFHIKSTAAAEAEAAAEAHAAALGEGASSAAISAAAAAGDAASATAAAAAVDAASSSAAEMHSASSSHESTNARVGDDVGGTDAQTQVFAKSPQKLHAKMARAKKAHAKAHIKKAHAQKAHAGKTSPQKVHARKPSPRKAHARKPSPQKALAKGDVASPTPESAPNAAAQAASASAPNAAASVADAVTLSSGSANAAAADSGSSSFENADAAAAEAVSNVGLHEKAGGEASSVGDIQNEAQEVENEEAQIVADSEGNEHADTDDEEFEDSVDHHADRKGGGASPDEEEPADLAEAQPEENTYDNFAAHDVNEEAKEIEDEDSQIENESLEDERAGAELDEISPKESLNSDLEDVADRPSLSAAPANAVALHVYNGNAMSRMERNHEKQRVGERQKAMAVGGAVDRMRQALQATAHLVPKAMNASLAVDAAPPKSAASLMPGDPAVVATEPASQHVLIQSKHKGSEETEAQVEEVADAGIESGCDDSIRVEDAAKVEAQRIQAEGNRGDEHMDAVEKAIVSDTGYVGAEALSDDASSEGVHSGGNAEGLDDIESAIVQEGDAQDKQARAQDAESDPEASGAESFFQVASKGSDGDDSADESSESSSELDEALKRGTDDIEKGFDLDEDDAAIVADDESEADVEELQTEEDEDGAELGDGEAEEDEQ